MRLTDLLFDNNLQQVVAGIFGAETRYQDADSQLPDTVEVYHKFDDLPEDQHFVYIQVILPILKLMRVKKGHRLEGCFNPTTRDFIWVPTFGCPKADGYVHDIPLVSVEQFKELLQTVRSRL